LASIFDPVSLEVLWFWNKKHHIWNLKRS